MNRRAVRRVIPAACATQFLVMADSTPAHADMPGVGIVKDVVGGSVGWAWDGVAKGIAGWVLGSVAYFVEGVLGFLEHSARPDVESAWFAGPGSPFATVRNIAGVLLVGFVFLGLIQGLVQGDAAGMFRRVAGNLPLAVAGMVVTTAVVGQLLDLTDQLSSAVLAASGQQSLHFLSGFGAAVTSGTKGFAAVLLGLVAVLAALLLWVELIVRSSLVYLLVAISPLGFAATLWPSARGFLRRTIEILLAVIVSKFVICVALAVGVAALSGAGEAGAGQSVAGSAGTSLTTLLIGSALLGLAAFSPFLILKLIPMAEGALIAQGISRSPARAAQSGASTWSSTQMVSRLSGRGSGGGAFTASGSTPAHGHAAGTASASPGARPGVAGAAGPGAARDGVGSAPAIGPSGAAGAAGAAGTVASAGRAVAGTARSAGETATRSARRASSSPDAPTEDGRSRPGGEQR